MTSSEKRVSAYAGALVALGITVGLVVLALCGCAFANSLSEIRSDCRYLVKDYGASRRRFSDTILNGFVNDGQNSVVQEALPIRKPFQFELVAGTTYYDLPSDFLAVTRLTRDYLVIKQESLASLDKRMEWQQVGGLPTSYYVSFASRTKVGFYPFPDTTSSTGTIRLEYAASIQAMDDDTDAPFSGIAELQPYANILSEFCAFKCSVIDGELDMAAVYSKAYEDGKKTLMNTSMMMPNYNPSITPATR